MNIKDTLQKREEKQKKRLVGISVDPDLHDKFKELTKKGSTFEKVSLSNAVNNMLKESIQFMEDTIKNKQEDISKNV